MIDLLSQTNQFSFVGRIPPSQHFTRHLPMSNLPITLIQILLSFSIILHYLDKHKTINLLSNTNISGLSHGRVLLCKALLCLCGDGCFKLARRTVLEQDCTHLDHFCNESFAVISSLHEKALWAEITCWVVSVWSPSLNICDTQIVLKLHRAVYTHPQSPSWG